MSELVNTFSFSFSKLKAFQKCQRQHYMSTYVQWNGWKSNAPKVQKQAYRLKKLTGLAAWMGSIVHDEISNVIRDMFENQPVSVEKSVDRMRESFARDFKISEARAKNPNSPAKMFGLKEHEYGEVITPDKKKDTWENAKACMVTFHASGVLERVRKAGKKNMLSIEELASFPVKSSDGIPVPAYSSPDLAFREGDNVIIYDWKTGKEDDSYSDQVAMYSLYAREHWGADPTKVEANIFYLLTNNNVSKMSTREWIDDAEAKIKQGIEDMRSMLVGKDISKNRPLPASEFKFTTSNWACRYCNFERICGIHDVKLGNPDPLMDVGLMEV